MSLSSKPTIILGVSGSIAAYKAAELTSQLRQQGCEIFVILTANATKFITPLTFQILSRNEVITHLFENPSSWNPQHIQLSDRADLLLIAPATANIIAKLSHGIADDALSSVALACPAPLVLAPAMNGKMWLHPTTQENVQRLKSQGAEFFGPEIGSLACGYEGMGKLGEIEMLLKRTIEILIKIKPSFQPCCSTNLDTRN